MTKLFEIHHQGAMTGKTTGSSSVPRCVPQATLEQVLLPRQVRTSATLAPSHNCLLSGRLLARRALVATQQPKRERLHAL